MYYVSIDSVINGLKAQKHSAQSNALGKRVIGTALRRSKSMLKEMTVECGGISYKVRNFVAG
ncbi:hypothetical protein CJ232_01950 [Hoylesella timonensis]|uniref:Uncharacterized protein n=1 Tax=Hoylesella timonensis TaxID=386414 RepID=A0A2N6Q824_9BACT|nr:hypothetical protein CJ232_01950 [Hoylesella timonensis]